MSDSELEKQIGAMFDSAREERFDYGEESALSQEIIFVVKQHGNIALKIVQKMIEDEAVNGDAAWEALRWLGKMEHPLTHEGRRELLEHLLRYPDHVIRDGALLGLASLDDPKSIPSLAEAKRVEPLSALHKFIDQVLEQLKQSQGN